MNVSIRNFLPASFLFALASALSIQSAVAQTGVASAQGEVVGPANQPQIGVPVKIEGPPGQTTAFTDREGKWSVYNLPAGEYQVRAVFDKSEAVTFSVKEPSFWGKMTGKELTVRSPSIKLEK